MANPNHPPTPNRLTLEQQKKDAISDFYSFLDAPAIATLRDEQYKLLAAKKQGIPLYDRAALQQAEADAYAEFAQLRENYLNRAGVAKDPTGQRTDFQDFEKILENYSVDKMDGIKWGVGTTDPTTGKLVTGYEEAEANFDQFVADMADTIPESVNTINASPELEEARDDLAKLREELATISAKRMGKMGSRRKTKEEFDRLQKEYNDKLLEVGQKEEELREQNDPNRTDEKKRLDVMMHLLEKENDLRELTNDKLSSTKLAKLSAWMNKGGKWGKIAKGAAVGIVIGAVSGGAGAVVVAVLTGMSVVGAGTAGATGVTILFGAGGRFITNFIRKNNDRKIAVGDADKKASEEALKSIDDVENKTHEQIQRTMADRGKRELRGDVENQQKRRRRAAYKAGGIALVGVGIGTAIPLVGNALNKDFFTPVFAEKHYGVNGMTSNGSGHVYGQNETQFSKGSEPKLAGSDVYPKAGALQHESVGAKLSDSDMYPKAAGPQPEVAGGGPEVTVAPEFSLEAQTIDPGEGLFKTFNEMKIPAEDHAELLQKVGPKLAELKDGSGRPFAYLINGEKGNWGIRMTPDGKMPVGALETIYAEHQQMLSASTPEAIAPSTITKMDVITPEEVANNDALKELANVNVNDGSIESGRAYAEALGFNPRAWDLVQHGMIEDYPDLFVEAGDGKIGIPEGLLPDDVAADLFNRLENVPVPSSVNVAALGTVEVSEVSNSLLDRLSIVPEFTDSAEKFMRDNGFAHAWLEIDKPSVASEIAKAAPEAFTFENNTLNVIPKGRITDEAWAIIASHMTAVERARVGIG